MNNPLLYFFALYSFYIVLPLLPTLILYKMFPDSKLAVSGPLQGLTLKATGAFAGYIICCLIGYFIVSKALDSIEQTQAHALKLKEIDQAKTFDWQIDAEINLVQSDGITKLDDRASAELLKSLQSTLEPPVISHGYNRVTMFLPERLKNQVKIIFTIPNFGASVTKVNADLMKAKVDYEHKIIDLGVITLQEYGSQQPYNKAIPANEPTSTGINTLPE